MIRIPRSLRVALAGTAAVATISAGVSALVATSASAAAAGTATTLTITPVYPTDNSASAGTCMIYRAFPRTDLAQDATDSGTVVISLQETPNSGSQDVDFCLPPTTAGSAGGTRVDYGYYTNADNSSGPHKRQTYCAGESLTPPAAASCSKATNVPDSPSNATAQSQPVPPVGANTNPSGEDFVDDVPYDNDSSTPAGNFVEFGVTGLLPGAATINACIDRNTNFLSSICDAGDGDAVANTVNVTFNAGGKPDSVEAYNAVTSITSDAPQYSAIQSPSTPAAIDLTLLNNAADTVFGVIPNFRVQSGPNASSTIRSCTRSTDFGHSACSYLGAIPGTDTILFWVNHSAPTNGTATAGPDPGEPSMTVFVTTYAAPAPASSARTIDLTPNTPTSTTAGDTKPFAAFVADSSGTPVQGASVVFSETGPGQISGGQSPDGNTSSKTVLTGPDGRALMSVVTQPGESGPETVTASISPNASQCGAQFNGQTGTCSDSTTNTVGGGPSPRPTPTGTRSPSPTPTGSPASNRPNLSTSTPDIQPNVQGVLTATNLSSNATYELRCYSRPSTTYFTARSATTSAGSNFLEFRILPGSNTRCYVRPAGNEALASSSVVINVHTTLSLSTVRTAVRAYTFQGRNLPRRAGQLITLYRVDAAGNEIRTSNLTTDSSGIYRVSRRFTGTGTFRFKVRTSQTLNNAAGVSNTITVAVH